MKFVPRRDLWLSAVIWLCVAVMVFAGISPFIIEGKGEIGTIGAMIILIICLAVAGFIAWLWGATYYVLKESELFVRNGPFRKLIPYETINKAEPIRSWLASSATSSRRIAINYGKYHYIHISPLDQDIFMTELKKRCSHARIESC